MLLGLAAFFCRLWPGERGALSAGSGLRTLEKLRLRWIENDVVLLCALVDMGHFFAATGDFWLESSWFGDPAQDAARTAQLLVAADFTAQPQYSKVVLGWLRNYSAAVKMWRGIAERAVEEGKTHAAIVMRFQNASYLSAFDTDFTPVCTTLAVASEKESCMTYATAINADSASFKNFFLETYLPACEKYRPDEKSGLWATPRGEEVYRAWLDYHLGFSISAEEIHALGKERLAENEKGILETIRLIDPSIASFEMAAKSLSNPDDRRWFFCGNDSSPVEDFVRIEMAKIESNLFSEFGYFSGARVAVTSTGSSSTYSLTGTYDHERNFWVASPEYNIGRYEWCTTLNGSAAFYYDRLQRSTVAHEAMPGHGHQLQLEAEVDCGIAAQYAFAPTLFCEGWALYTETLLYEMGASSSSPKGLLTDPADELSFLISQILRNVRLSVDAGIHGGNTSLSWSECVSEMMNASFSQFLSEVECERYVQMPGQAVAYMLGFLEMEALRNRTEAALGNAFDSAEFHNVLLRFGGTLLNDTKSLVETYIAFKQGLGETSMFGADLIRDEMFSRSRPTVGLGRKTLFNKNALQQSFHPTKKRPDWAKRDVSRPFGRN